MRLVERLEGGRENWEILELGNWEIEQSPNSKITMRDPGWVYSGGYLLFF